MGTEGWRDGFWCVHVAWYRTGSIKVRGITEIRNHPSGGFITGRDSYKPDSRAGANTHPCETAFGKKGIKVPCECTILGPLDL